MVVDRVQLEDYMIACSAGANGVGTIKLKRLDEDYIGADFE